MTTPCNIARSGAKRWLRTSPRACHDHSKNVIGRDDGSISEERPADWWPEKPTIPEDAPRVNFRVQLSSGKSFVDLVGRQGESIEDVCKREGLMEGACDGNCQCSTCHVFVPDPDHQTLLGMPDSVEEFELDMLELAAKYEDDPEASRLACQIVLDTSLEGITVRLPDRTINYMDHFPLD